MLWFLLVFAVAFLQNWISTLEVYLIAHGKPSQVAHVDLINGIIGWSVLILFVTRPERIQIAAADILGGYLATYLCMRRLKR